MKNMEKPAALRKATGQCTEDFEKQMAASEGLLASSRERACEQGITIEPYLSAVYIEYLELRETAVRHYGERVVEAVENEMARVMDSRVVIRLARRKSDPMYS